MTIYGVRRSYHKKFSFVVEIAGVASAWFKTCSPIDIEVGVVEQREGGSLVADKSPGLVTIPNVTLTRGVTQDFDLWTWMSQVVAADAILADPDHERSIDVVQLDRKQQELHRFTLVGCWPRKWSSGDWDGAADENRIESVELAYRYPIRGGEAAQ